MEWNGMKGRKYGMEWNGFIHWNGMDRNGKEWSLGMDHGVQHIVMLANRACVPK